MKSYEFRTVGEIIERVPGGQRETEDFLEQFCDFVRVEVGCRMDWEQNGAEALKTEGFRWIPGQWEAIKQKGE